MPNSHPTHDVSGASSSLNAPDLAFGVTDEYGASLDPTTWFDPSTWFPSPEEPLLEAEPFFPEGQPVPTGADPHAPVYEHAVESRYPGYVAASEHFQPPPSQRHYRGAPPALPPPIETPTHRRGESYSMGYPRHFEDPGPPWPEPPPEEEPEEEEVPPSPYWGVPVTATYPIGQLTNA
jgi:hypothetical protein